MPLRTVTFIAALCLTTGWLLASVISPPVAELQTLPSRASARPAPPATNESPYAEQLQWRLGQAPGAPTPKRNPFVFGGRLRSAAPQAPRADVDATTGSATVVPSLPSDARPMNLGPPLRLLGIGSRVTPEGTVWTAVLSDGTKVHLAKAGDVISGYAVAEVSEDAVTLADAAGAQWKLRLK